MGQATANGIFGLLINALVEIGGTAVSDHIREDSIEVEGLDEEEVSAMGDTLWAKFNQGRHAIMVTLRFWQNFYAGEIDRLLWTLITATAGTTTTVAIAPENTTVSDKNPKFTFTCLKPRNYNPIAAQFEANLEASVTFRVTGAPTKAITP